MRCPCGHVGEMRVVQVTAGARADSGGPAEDATFEAACPACRATRDLDHGMVNCDSCGVLGDPDEMIEHASERICTDCNPFAGAPRK